MTGYKRKRTRIVLICDDCAGLGRIATPQGIRPCGVCGGSGEVEGWIVELVRENQNVVQVLDK